MHLKEISASLWVYIDSRHHVSLCDQTQAKRCSSYKPVRFKSNIVSLAK